MKANLNALDNVPFAFTPGSSEELRTSMLFTKEPPFILTG